MASTSTANVDAPGLTPQQLADFERDGFLVVPGFATPDQVSALLSRGRHLLQTFDPATVASVFTTRDQSASVSANYFAESASKVSFFFEEGAVVKRGDSPSSFELAVPKEDAVNKIGHALHDVDPVFRSFARENPRLTATLRSLGYQKPLPVQSMYICKPPRLGGEVVPHQDACFLRTKPRRSVVGCWLALERAGVDNGCLWAVPRSHRVENEERRKSKRLFLGHGKVFGRREDGSVGWCSGANERDDGENAAVDEGERPASSSPPTPYDSAPDLPTAGAVPLVAEPGTLVLLDGAVVHFSKANDRSGGTKGEPSSRHAFALHFVEGGKTLKWHEGNWLQRPAEAPFEALY